MPIQRLVIDDFTGGLSPSRSIGAPNQVDSYFDTNTGGWTVDVIDDEGILRRGYMNSTITNVSVIGSYPRACALDDRNNTDVFLYTVGDSYSASVDHLNQVAIATRTVTNGATFPQTLPTKASAAERGWGMEIFNAGGTSYLYYSTGRYLGRYDLSLTFNHCFNVSMGTTTLGNYVDHPMTVGNGKIWIGNVDRISNTPCITSVDGSDVVTIKALDLSRTDQIVRAVAFNKSFLFIASDGALNTSGSQSMRRSTLYVWDTVSSSWQDQYEFPDTKLSTLKFNNGQLHAMGRNGTYAFTGGGFELIQPYSNTGPTGHHSADVGPKGILYWLNQSGSVFSYGTFSQQIRPYVQRPFRSAAYPGDGVVKWANNTQLYVSQTTANQSLKCHAPNSEAFDVTAEYRTPMLNLGGRTRLVRIYIYFFSWPSGTTVDVKWSKDTGVSGNTTTLGTISTAGNTSWVYQADGLVADQWQIVLSHTAGATTPKFRRIVIEYEPDMEG